MKLDDIKQEIDHFNQESITIVDGYDFNQKANIEREVRYYNSKYLHGDIDVDGDKKYFINISRHPCRLTTKAIDFDTKHIKVHTASGGKPLVTWFFERDLKFWMKDQYFGKILNRIFQELPIFGSVVLKIIDGEPHFVDLRNFIVNEQSADTLDQANSLIEIHRYVPAEFKKMGEKMGWSNVNKALKEFKKMEKPYIRVYERYGEIDGTYKRTFWADVGVDEEIGGETHPHKGVQLKETEVSSHPYFEFHLEKTPGRWQGISVVENLFDTQVRLNENENLLSKASYWASLHLFQSADETVSQNLKDEARDGQVVNADQPINQIEIAERNLAYFNKVTEKWLQNRDEQVFSHDVVSGERLPAGTPLGSAKIAAAMSGGYFDQIMENVALDVKRFLMEVIVPGFRKQANKEHELRLAGNDLDKYNNLLIKRKVKRKILDMALDGNVPLAEKKEALEKIIGETVKRGVEKLVPLKSGFYDANNLKYKIDIIITGEQKNAAVRAQSLFAALQAVTADPTLLTDPTKKKMFSQWLEEGGLHLPDIMPESPPPSVGEPSRAGGGVSRPAPAPEGAVGGARI